MDTLRTSALLFIAALSLAACGGAEADPSSGAGKSQPTTAERSARHDDVRRADSDDRSRGGGSERRARENPRGGEHLIESATLELSGDRGTGFSGVCRVGGQERELAGTVPETVELDLGGGPLECRLENQGPGTLTAELSVGNAHYTQQASAQGSTLNFALSGEGYRSSTSSVSAVEAETPDAVSNASARAVAGPRDEK